MKSPLRRIAVRFVLVASVWLLAAPGCGRIPGQFEFLHNQVPEPGCLISGDEDHVYQSQGRLDVSLVKSSATAAFWVFPVLKNNLASSTEGADLNQIFLNSFAVDIRVLTGPEALADYFDTLENNTAVPGKDTRPLLHFKTPTSGSVGSGGDTIATIVPAIGTELAALLAGQPDVTEVPSLYLNLQIRAFGTTTSQSVESDPFNYPVAVCNGCLVSNVQPCPYQTAPSNPGNECNIAQDAPVDCCLSGTDLICPPPVVP